MRLGGLGKRNQFLEVELKLCSCLFLVVDAAWKGRGGCGGDNARTGKEMDRKEGRGIDLVPGRIFH